MASIAISSTPVQPARASVTQDEARDIVTAWCFGLLTDKRLDQVEAMTGNDRLRVDLSFRDPGDGPCTLIISYPTGNHRIPCPSFDAALQALDRINLDSALQVRVDDGRSR